SAISCPETTISEGQSSISSCARSAAWTAGLGARATSFQLPAIGLFREARIELPLQPVGVCVARGRRDEAAGDEPVAHAARRRMRRKQDVAPKRAHRHEAGVERGDHVGVIAEAIAVAAYRR